MYEVRIGWNPIPVYHAKNLHNAVLWVMLHLPKAYGKDGIPWGIWHDGKTIQPITLLN